MPIALSAVKRPRATRGRGLSGSRLARFCVAGPLSVIKLLTGVELMRFLQVTLSEVTRVNQLIMLNVLHKHLF